ncbi:Speract receptor,Guanylate cyclase 32E,Receptor-type guanylate cyclase gcy-28,Receptor-type guanylate cyclase gcy-1,Receptor-type guanylate cyclase gcy-4,Receptor-type guanylate cyclase gcy-20,Heat-stable enterotoxin receptor,Olfactory guanylyl cyclase GC-D,Atrial natriuretic peptide receptor 2,Atrial natriuretic peptide receptor 1,Receptor-type guanylate cyclase gcy-13,Retinal guanylyl cyclase 2,Receptor-type guanylate cyclase gcy-12,Receptor-type guanylate cyclase gcy-29,Receptor-type guanylate cyclase G|uniref:Guanylate cyclase n=1 Tax=Lepeophtheirus salmonis TaxID=72036 RepID=A0A7R8CEN5_LEPSM|nr:Speract receptor,Guanylate cyclase 32E,Receptor-type guanylate cyclase gcy-28,Receptor-type guanylate cyclase gcy-1,Receptor-type guanylate cyclase gcy-4,Receptor-type guanylate cyclase gcy-20,Heat-stable enterotoxin receptor,Olfactory guanylyl cyclase GC-D,Atrial natriuretic peptide receptor 2,Atrial natriuretic peptide receptor 1,Receptor-type guanylate cyclase gcy-13,Retinal guanylyl cyclase 2,Receptor-type guanylate cyclase gcy-12,Receptor-type guanylate cyclase gcy-29,Receptor-type guanylat
MLLLSTLLILFNKSDTSGELRASSSQVGPLSNDIPKDERSEGSLIYGNITTVSGIELTLFCDIKLFECGNFYSVELYHESIEKRVFIYHHAAGIFKSEGSWSERVSYFYDASHHQMNIVLNSAHLEDEGSYRCEITYEDPDRWFSYVCFKPQILNVRICRSQSIYIFTWAMEPLLRTDLRLAPFTRGFSLVLICLSGSGKPSSQISWWNGTNEMSGAWNWKIQHKNGTESVKSEIQILLSRFDFGKVFTCRAHNEALDSPMESSTILDMDIPPNYLSIGSPIQTAEEGVTFTVACNARNAKPPAYIYWNSEPLLNFDNVTEISEPFGNAFQTTSLLTFVTQRHLISLSCFASNDLLDRLEGTHLRVDTTINVRYKPRIRSQELKDIKVFEGETLSINCSYESNPMDAFVTWYLNGMNISSPGQSRDVSLFKLVNITSSMSGVYSCMIENEVGKSPIFNLANVIVLMKPLAFLLMSPPNPVFESMSQNVTLICLNDAQDDEKFSSVKWFLNGELLKHVSVEHCKGKEVCNVNPSKIILVNVKRAFKGNYSCQGLYGNEWTGISETKEIRVHYPPRVKSIHSIPSIIECVLEDFGFPPANKVHWYKNGERVYGETSFTINIAKASSKTDGIYSCTPYTSISMAEDSDIILSIQCLPRFTMSLSPVIEMNQSDGNITLDCHAKCADPCDIYWYLNQTKFSRLTNVTKFTRKREGYSLYSIESKVDLNCRDYASSNVSVSYTCRVLSRDAESIQTTARIKVYYPPKNIVTFRSIQNRQSTLQCYVDANPKAEYIWYDSSGKILSKKAKFIWTDDDAESKHVLGPTSITCKAFNTYGSLLSSMKLDPSNSTSSCHIQKTEFENDYVELNCESGGSDKFIWYFNGETLIELNESKSLPISMDTTHADLNMVNISNLLPSNKPDDSKSIVREDNIKESKTDENALDSKDDVSQALEERSVLNYTKFVPQSIKSIVSPGDSGDTKEDKKFSDNANINDMENNKDATHGTFNEITLLDKMESNGNPREGNGDEKEKFKNNNSKSNSRIVMSKHAVNLGCYTLNLGTDSGQKIYSMLMIVLPMIPLLILIGRISSNLVYNQNSEKDLKILRKEVMDALDIANLVQELQKERAAVALNNFLWNMDSSPNIDSIKKISKLTLIDVDDLNKALNLSTRFADTDSALESINNWPSRMDIQSHNWPGKFFNSKLSFQEDYLHNAYNSMPNITITLDAIIKDPDIRWKVYNNSRAEVTRNANINSNTKMAVQQFEAMFMYASALRRILVEMSNNIKYLVDNHAEEIKHNSKWPIILMICLVISVPIIVYLSSKASYSMRHSSKMFDEQAEILNKERRKTDGLLWQLLPPDIIAKLKAGDQPPPKLYESATVFFGDIVGFTNLTAMSTAGQTIQFLNDLYNMFDNYIDNFDVYKVEIVGDGYLVASGLPIPNGYKHATEIATMALQLMFQVEGFKISHKPTYKLRMRMGIHSGGCVGSVVGSKMPHFSVFGDTVNIAALMESTSEPMKIQISETTKRLLEKGKFETEVRGQIIAPRIGELTTHWLHRKVLNVNPSIMDLSRTYTDKLTDHAGEKIKSESNLLEPTFTDDVRSLNSSASSTSNNVPGGSVSIFVSDEYTRT